MKKKIYLSPSSQPNNTYAGLDTNEQEECRGIARELKTDLERCGFEVKCGDYGTMYSRVTESNKWCAHLHLPIHTNACDGKVSGTRLMANNTSGAGFKVCEAISKHLYPITPGKSENIQAKPGLYEIKAAYAPTAYVEVDFHDVPDVALWLTQNKPQIAQAIEIMIHTERTERGRKVVEITELSGYESGEFKLNVLMESDGTGMLMPTGRKIINRKKLDTVDRTK